MSNITTYRYNLYGELSIVNILFIPLQEKKEEGRKEKEEEKIKEGKQNRQDPVAIVVDLTFTMIKCQMHGPEFMACMYVCMYAAAHLADSQADNSHRKYLGRQ